MGLSGLLIQAGHTADSAIDKIYNVEGAISVTKIIRKICNDESNGGHPELN
jgi:hypothetical protein